MPTPYIKSLSKKGKGSVKTLEKKWDRAKDAAKKQGKGDNWALVTHIFKNAVGASLEVKAFILTKLTIEATLLRATSRVEALSLNRDEALKHDESFNIDKAHGSWCVFGDTTDFCYSQHDSEDEAEQALKKMPHTAMKLEAAQRLNTL